MDSAIINGIPAPPGFADSWAFDRGARNGGEAGGGEFVEAGGEGHGADVHRFHQRIADDVDGEFLVELNVARGVLRLWSP
jgi:hypothetical protein